MLRALLCVVDQLADRHPTGHRVGLSASRRLQRRSGALVRRRRERYANTRAHIPANCRSLAHSISQQNRQIPHRAGRPDLHGKEAVDGSSARYIYRRVAAANSCSKRHPSLARLAAARVVSVAPRRIEAACAISSRRVMRPRCATATRGAPLALSRTVAGPTASSADSNTPGRSSSDAARSPDPLRFMARWRAVRGPTASWEPP
jgi:hypothetical protein